ncbi:MAG: hypothetical protein JWQ81_3158 [Amycolatopsis sp.]|jgi:uncharacterized protein YndB with AHSA1/START domain|uniref:SRPBCC family protein n=1 Tax=Amycolatopsis sp. TaxID=37632 RepID=UPI0026092C66|nr:SRPBCC family protein [Amycolatopsis sp.]MCU1682419.1 hypothetical protein [Amycolatopsis sp.]MDX6665602.1 hypothetical protein [Solirubrobacteraceae bacterium]
MTQTIESVRKTITVACGQARAFQVYTEGFGTWWPRQHSIGEAAQSDVVLEPKVGGRWYEIGVDGSECDWGTVLAYEPPSRVVLTWQLNGDWAYDPDVSHASEIEVRFIAEGPAATRVELEHRGFERHGEGAESVRSGVDSPDGHEGLLRLFATAAAA